MFATARITFSFLAVLLMCCQADALAQAQPGGRPLSKPQAGGKILDAQQLQAQANLPPAGPPKDFQLSAAQQKRIDQMLTYWQKKTEGIQTFSTTFGRWVYDPVFGPKNQAKTFSTGEIRYSAVDKGMIREDKVYDYDKAKDKAGVDWPFTESKDAIGEHWVCTGRSVFEYDHKQKKLNEIKLPPNMQGKAIAEGPLPFMFGAKAETIKKRYWIREIARKNAEAPYQMELMPKRRGETYAKIRISLDAKKFLPTEMVLYDLNSMGRSSYAFKEMVANSPKHKVGAFMGRFIAPKVPRGYQLVVFNPNAPGAQPQKAEGATPTRR